MKINIDSKEKAIAFVTKHMIELPSGKLQIKGNVKISNKRRVEIEYMINKRKEEIERRNNNKVVSKETLENFASIIKNKIVKLEEKLSIYIEFELLDELIEDAKQQILLELGEKIISTKIFYDIERICLETKNYFIYISYSTVCQIEDILDSFYIIEKEITYRN